MNHHPKGSTVTNEYDSFATTTSLGEGSVVSITPAAPGHVAVVGWHRGNEGPAGAVERFPVIGWAIVVYGFDTEDRALTRIEPWFVCNEVVATQSGMARVATVEVCAA